VDPCYSVSAFAEQYSSQRTGSIELLLDSELQENLAVRAPIVARKRGRPKSTALPSGDDGLLTPVVASALLSGGGLLLGSDDADGKRRCSVCGQAGHSKRTCDQNAPSASALASEAAPNMMV